MLKIFGTNINFKNIEVLQKYHQQNSDKQKRSTLMRCFLDIDNMD